MTTTCYEEKILTLAAEHQINRSALAYNLGITTATLAKRLKLRSEWSLSELVVLSALLGVSVAELAADAYGAYIDANPDSAMAAYAAEVKWVPIDPEYDWADLDGICLDQNELDYLAALSEPELPL